MNQWYGKVHQGHSNAPFLADLFDYALTTSLLPTLKMPTGDASERRPSSKPIKSNLSSTAWVLSLPEAITPCALSLAYLSRDANLSRDKWHSWIPSSGPVNAKSSQTTCLGWLDRRNFMIYRNCPSRFWLYRFLFYVPNILESIYFTFQVGRLRLLTH